MEQNNLENLTRLYKLRKNSFGKYYSEIQANIDKISLSENKDLKKNDKNNLDWLIWQTPHLAIQILFLVLWSLSLYFFYKIYNLKKILKTYVFIFFLTLILGILLIFSNNKRYKKVAILKQESAIKVGPSSDYTNITFVPKFSYLEILSKKEGWYKIRADSIIGWLPKDDLEIID